MQPWPKIADDEVVRVGWRTIVKKTFRTPDGRTAQFSIKDPNGSRTVAVIALNKDGRVVIARQFRQGPEKIMEEIPGGAVEPGEDLQVAVARELHEETGYRAKSMKYLGYVYKDGVSNTQSHYYFATECYIDGAPHTDDTEFIEVDAISIADLISNAKNGLMTDSDAVFLAYDDLSKALDS